MKTEFKNNKYHISFPSRMWLVGVFWVSALIYLWLFTDISFINARELSIYMVLYLIVTYVFVMLYHPVTVEVDMTRRKFIQIDNFYVNRRKTEHNIDEITKIELVKHTYKSIKYFMWGYKGEKKFAIGQQISQKDHETARQAGQKLAELLKIEFKEI